MSDIEDAMMHGIVFKGGDDSDKDDSSKVKTKAKKTAYIHGAHGSGAARMRETYRKRRANRHKPNKE